MTLFYYKAVTPSGETLEGQFDLATRDEVIGKLQDAGNIPLDVREADSGDSSWPCTIASQFLVKP